MSAKIYWHFLFFCVILCQAIFATLSDKDTRVSSDFLVRNRRVINHLPGGRSAVRIESVNYIVRIKNGTRVVCAGAILSHYTVITAASCTQQHISNYQIQSGVAGNTSPNIHNVTSRVVNQGSPPYHIFDGIALITVDPPFVYTRKTGYIQLYGGPLPTGTLVEVFGWGYMYPMQPGTEMKPRLRTINLPIMNHEECRTLYQGRLNITEKHICTYHSQQYCARYDEGAPLVLNGHLVGIHVWKGEIPCQRNPDIFINIQRPDYREWINENSLLM